ncbi:efflux RND transporter permease subunit [Paracoccus sp. SCSIO 75233]|uniref:efflux RND transporter permease subunit n=1 Tax=Paracoccus sp. SCSIO 75233 TaxID=3017782 RepID=UPI0022F1091A|nr:efflux RND transporter permease subunit [Paracoccus sp. SCSIO 75233]WBU51947.1 efflux RND transporter permease subunit [Paracoccus sp. SCSIO 75233]
MSLPELSLRRPVLATVMSLLIMLLGIMALTRLPLRELPQVEAAQITVSVDYTGASPDVVDNQVATVVEGALAGITGLRSISTESERGGMRTVMAFDPSRNMDEAANDVRNAVERVVNQLPDGAERPRIDKNDSEGDPVMRLSLASPDMTPLELSDFADRFLTDRLARLPGVANAAIFGERSPAMRLWLDPARMAAYGITTSDIVSALRANNIELPAGEIETGARQLQVLAETRFSSADGFRQVVIRNNGARPLRLGDVAEIEEGPAQRNSIFRSNGALSLGLGIQAQARSNTVAISRAVREELARIRPTLPENMTLIVTSDEAVFIESSIEQVLKVFAEAVALVTAVIFLFLGSLRLSMVPVVTIPISALGAALSMMMLGFTINILTLFALILAIGLVVDDAIVVLENIQRHRAMGESRAEAARRGAGQVSFAVIATTAVLIAVFLPVSFMQGEIGQLFAEFGITLAVAVAVSGFVALTLSPVLAARAMPREDRPNLLTRGVDRMIKWLERIYRTVLDMMIARPLPILAVTAFIMAGAFAIYQNLPKQLTPDEDRNSLMIFVAAPQGANLEYTDAAVRKIEAMLEPLREDGTISNITAIVGSWGEERRAMLFVSLVPWGERDMGVGELVSDLRPKLATISEVATFVRPAGGLGIGGSVGNIRWMLGGPDVERTAAWAEQLAAMLEGDSRLASIEVSATANQPGASLLIDRARAQDLGLDAETVGETLQVLFASSRVGEYSRDGRQYPVILQAAPEDRDSIEDMLSVLLRNNRGDLIPLSAFASMTTGATMPEINRYDRLISIEMQADLTEGVDLANAMSAVEAAVLELPAGAVLAWEGQASDYLESSGGIAMVFALALSIVFLVLAAQFESFRTPITIMLTVPLGLAGAVVTILMTGGTVNIFSQVGMILMIGIMAKNGILIVEFANQLREAGKPLVEAAREGAVTRLRPVLMTTIATVLGAVPLARASGAGAESRRAIGTVIVGGLSLAFVLTLLLTPVIYVLIERLRFGPEDEAEPKPRPAPPTAQPASGQE